MTIITQESLREFAPELAGPRFSKVKPALLTDVLRLRVLRDFGGIWVDATTFAMQPLSQWLPHSSFFAFRNPGPDRMLASWFLASEPADYIVVTLYETLVRYLTTNDFRSMRLLSAGLDRLLARNQRSASLWFSPLFVRTVKLRPYYTFHYLFAELYRTDPRFAQEWTETPAVPADPAHRLQHHGLTRPPTDAIRREIDEAQSPLYKLNRRTEIRPGSVLEYLLQTS